MTYIIGEIIIYVACALIAVFLVPLLKEKLGAEKYAQLLAIVKTAVSAAEKKYEDIDNDNERHFTKKQYVLDYLAEKGISLSEAELDALINSAVLELDKAFQ
jgi:rubrerythrin